MLGGPGPRRTRPCSVDPVHFVIMGCGRVGASLAHSIESNGHSVAVIDENPDAFRKACTAAVEVAKRVNAKWMTVVPGNVERKLPIGIQTANVIDVLRAGAEILERHAVELRNHDVEPCGALAVEGLAQAEQCQLQVVAGLGQAQLVFGHERLAFVPGRFRLFAGGDQFATLRGLQGAQGELAFGNVAPHGLRVTVHFPPAAAMAMSP